MCTNSESCNTIQEGENKDDILAFISCCDERNDEFFAPSPPPPPTPGNLSGYPEDKDVGIIDLSRQPELQL
jgi:hypothetical protein